MYILYFYINADEEGKLKKQEFKSEIALNDFIMLYKESIEIFDIR